jgi:hypothetical protein
MTDLNLTGVAASIASDIAKDIDLYAQNVHDDGPRTHLGASQIGHECSRYLWYVFRWCLHEKFSGRMQRLFNRGHLEEQRFIFYLEGIGAKVWALDVNGKQFRINGAEGHFGGSLDAVIELPTKYGVTEPLLGEFKTNGTGAGFQGLAKHKLARQKPQHFAQTSVYGYKGVKGQQFFHVLYLNVCKNDDDLYIEIAKLDHHLGQQMEMRAERIIFSREAPERLSNNPTFLTCKMCAMASICHAGSPPTKNCRSCKHAVPASNAEWFCEHHNSQIPKEFIAAGCDNWFAVTR